MIDFDPTAKVPGMLAIGGVGGSGTRVIAGLLQEVGFYLGSDLNEPKDNLWFTLLFKRREILRVDDEEFEELVGIFADAMHAVPIKSPKRIKLIQSLTARSREQHPVDWLEGRAESLLQVIDRGAPKLVGWKEPNTHIVLDRLVTHMPAVRYVHVIRNGLDMALSRNQNQTRLWGPLITEQPFDPSPRYSLYYWRKAQERILKIAYRMGERFHLVNFDKLCTRPSTVIQDLLNFVGIRISAEVQRELCAAVNPPASLGRFRKQDPTAFDPEDVAFVASCGFPTF